MATSIGIQQKTIRFNKLEDRDFELSLDYKFRKIKRTFMAISIETFSELGLIETLRTLPQYLSLTLTNQRFK